MGSFKTKKVNDCYCGQCLIFQEFLNMFQKQDLFQASSAKGGEVPVQWELLKRIRLHHSLQTHLKGVL